MAARDRAFFQQGINNYVKAMQYSAAMVHGQPTPFNLGTPAAASNTKFATGLAANAATNTILPVTPIGISDATYGRNISYTPSGVPGNANVVNVYGQDYLGQPMVEQFTGSAAASSTIVGKKAFYRVLSAKIVTPSTNPITFSIGTDSKLGFPFKGVIAFAREAGVIVQKASIVANTNEILGDTTDPATFTTGDPRGMYLALAALNGANGIEIDLFGDMSVNANNNGGLYGIQHYYA